MATDEDETERQEVEAESKALSPILIGICVVGAFCTIVMLKAAWDLLQKYGSL